ncbi:MAG: MFS transporter [Solirubrobacteraceae bacterium]
MSYRRDAFTWTAFGALFAFGYLMAILGPALPYIRSVEGIPYLVGVLHQVAWAVGGGLAGVLSARGRVRLGRRAMIAIGIAGGALAGLALGYGEIAPVTIAGAFLMGLLATLALIRVWAALADAHAARRAVAMTEGEVAVSLAGVATPLLIAGLAATAATWRLAFAIGTVTGLAAAAAVLRTHVPAPKPALRDRPRRGRAQPTLVIIFAIVALEFALSFWLASYLNDDVGLARDTAVALVSGMYAANLLGRVTASRLARTQTPERLLVIALGTVLAGLPFLLAATSATAVVPGIMIAGTGIGALFPLTSSLHIQASGRTADSALGQTMTVAAFGQTSGPLVAGAIAQVSSLRAGLLVLPVLTLLAATGLAVHGRHAASATAESCS